MNILEIRPGIERSSRVTFALSGGPGGQNVNKVNTKAVIHLNPEELECLTGDEKALVREKLKNRINSEGFLVVESSLTRSQFRNRQAGFKVMTELIVKSLEKKTKRRNTRPTWASVHRRLDSKKHRGMIKKGRGKVNRHTDY